MVVTQRYTSKKALLTIEGEFDSMEYTIKGETAVDAASVDYRGLIDKGIKIVILFLMLYWARRIMMSVFGGTGQGDR